MPIYEHGGDVWGRGGVLDFSANLNPLGPPASVLAAARAAVSEADRYPDPLCSALREAIAARDGASPEQVVCGAGAADLIFRLALALRPRRALVTAPAFSEYERALSLCGCAVARWPLSPENGFRLDDGILRALDNPLDLVFLCNPNNPTGALIDPGLLARIAAACGRAGTLLVVDECFLELTERAPDAAPFRAPPNVFALRAFTKTYAIPGLRLGYGLCAGAALIERLHATGQPWAVSNVAQAAGLAACACPDWPGQARALLRRERPALQKSLSALGLRVFPGAANYLLFRAPGCFDLRERLLERGVLIRACGNFEGLSNDYYRVCVRTAAENAVLLRSLEEVKTSWQSRL